MSVFTAAGAQTKPSPGDSGLIRFEEKRFLIIDDIVGMRSSMRITVSTFGGVFIDMAGSAGDALYRMEHNAYDIVLCDYDLGPGKDGQNLLEEIRRRKLMKHSAIFMMVTAERGYEKVVSAVELAPDDYLIKPFTGETLQVRLERLTRKKVFFAPVYDLMDRQDYRQALQVCDTLLNAPGQYLIDLMRLKGEMLLLLGEYAQAKALYGQILAIRDIPWARMGLAKAVFHQAGYEEAAELFQQVADDNPNYLEAYDWLAKTYAASGDEAMAQEVLKAAAARSPRTLHRQKSLGEAAYENGDLDGAREAFGAVLEFGKYSAFTTPEDYANLSRIHLEQGDYGQALAVMGEARDAFDGSPEAELHAAVMDSMVHRKAGNPAAADQAWAQAMQLYGAGGAGEAVSLDLARVCFERGDEEAGKKIVQGLVKNHHDDNRVLKRTERMFHRVGMLDKGREIIRDSSREVVALNNRAVRTAQAGDLKGAVDLLMQAVEQFQANNAVILNAAHAILAYLQKEGWDEDLVEHARKYLATVKQRDPDNQKYLTLCDLFKATAQKYGVKV